LALHRESWLKNAHRGAIPGRRRHEQIVGVSYSDEFLHGEREPHEYV
jgi:hypothetical protein